MQDAFLGLLIVPCYFVIALHVQWNGNAGMERETMYSRVSKEWEYGNETLIAPHFGWMLLCNPEWVSGNALLYLRMY